MHIALTGKFRSGKDTVADYLVQRYGYKKFAFGDRLKEDFHKRFPEVPREPKPRAGYQMFCQMMRRMICEDIWVIRCFWDVLSHLAEENPAPVVVSDLRQPNEYARCLEERFVVVRVNCPDEIRIERARAAGDEFGEEDLSHETEQHVDSFEADFELDNSRDFDHLYRQIDEMMHRLRMREGQAFGNDCATGACEP